MSRSKEKPNDVEMSSATPTPPENDTENENPLVFQCGGCLNILGDSLAWEGANEELKTITLDKVTEAVVVGKKMIFSAEGVDKGSGYVPLSCKMCKHQLGHMYKTTPVALDWMRDKYSLAVQSFQSYQLGSGTHECKTGDPSMSEAMKKIHQVQVVLLDLRYRLEMVESKLNIREEFTSKQ